MECGSSQTQSGGAEELWPVALPPVRAERVA
jgi:hypothetical protein